MVSLLFIGLILIGLGCAPIYPSIIHETPANFGADLSQGIIGIQMAFAYVGTCLMPPVFGVLGQHISFSVFYLNSPGLAYLVEYPVQNHRSSSCYLQSPLD